MGGLFLLYSTDELVSLGAGRTWGYRDSAVYDWLVAVCVDWVFDSESNAI